MHRSQNDKMETTPAAFGHFSLNLFLYAMTPSTTFAGSGCRVFSPQSYQAVLFRSPTPRAASFVALFTASLLCTMQHKLALLFSSLSPLRSWR